MKTIRTIQLAAFTLLFLGFTSCDNDDNDSNSLEVESNTITNLQATQSADYSTNPPSITGDYIKFSFTTGATTTGDEWDIAFRGSTIIVNGGEATTEDQPERTGEAAAYIASGTLASVVEVNSELFVTDSATDGLAIPTGSDNGWYNYNATTHVISPIAGKVIVVKTVSGTYAKFEITSYYQDGEPNEELSNSQYYTFNYVYNPNEGETSFE
tara:strand:+ start:320 stop:955 length:636 start_codon:yes stop_codon:yes gene_type:complete